MMKNSFLNAVFLCLLAFSYNAQSEPEPESPKHIISGTWYEINSKVMTQSRRYAVHLPPSYYGEEKRSYPVLYVLDGYATRMRGVAGMIEALSWYDLSQQIPEFIVVAIPNSNRSRDLTPTKGDLVFKGKILDQLADNSGGAHQFAKFIREELFLKVNNQFRTTDQRGILGMSFGGLFAAHVMLTHPDMFSHYLISDATFVWDDNYLNRTLESSVKNLANQDIKVFIGLANNDHLGELGMTNRQWGNDFVSGLQHIDNQKLIVSSRYFPEEQHGTVMYLAFYYGLIALFGNS